MKRIPISIDEIDKFVDDDHFSDEEINDPTNINYLKELDTLKTDFKKMLRSNTTADVNIGDIINGVQKHILQIERLRCVISPKLKMVVQKADDREYLFARGYWIRDDGKRNRGVAKLFGRMDVKFFVHPTPEEVKLSMRRSYSRKYHETYN